MATHTTLASLFSDIANAIRNLTGSSAPIKADDFPAAISGITNGVVDWAWGYGYGDKCVVEDMAGVPVSFFINCVPDTMHADDDDTVLCVHYDGTNTEGIYVSPARASSLQGGTYCKYSSTAFSWSYDNGYLTITSNDATLRFPSTTFNCYYAHN